MATFLTSLLIVIILVFYFYKKAKNKQAQLRAKSRANYSDIQNAIFVWAGDKDNSDKLSLALSALEIYDSWLKEVEFFPVTYRSLSAEQFELVDEWRKIVEEDKLLRNPRVDSGAKSAIAYEFSYAISELREIKHQLAQHNQR